MLETWNDLPATSAIRVNVWSRSCSRLRVRTASAIEATCDTVVVIGPSLPLDSGGGAVRVGPGG